MRLVILFALVLLLLVALLSVDLSDQALDHDSLPVKTVQQWGTEKPNYIVEASMFTTTTTPRPRSAPKIRTASAAPAVVVGRHEPGFINGYPCGGPDLPSCHVMQRESKGIPTAYNPTGCGGRSCGGLFQFDPVTWIPGCTVTKWNDGKCGDYMGYQYAHLAPVDVQYARTREIYNHGAGCGHWADC